MINYGTEHVTTARYLYAGGQIMRKGNGNWNKRSPRKLALDLTSIEHLTQAQKTWRLEREIICKKMEKTMLRYHMARRRR